MVANLARLWRVDESTLSHQLLLQLIILNHYHKRRIQICLHPLSTHHRGSAMPFLLTIRTIGCMLAMSALATDVFAQQQSSNFGFEAHSANGRPVGWGVNGNGFEAVVDSVAPFEGQFSLRTRWLDLAPVSLTSPRYANVSKVFPVAMAAGRKLHLTGYIRTENIRTGFAGFWMRVDGPDHRQLAFDNMAQRAARGTTPWTRYDIELPVDSGAVGVFFGLLRSGDGTAWYDSLALEVVGDPMPRSTAAFSPESRPAEEMGRLLTDAELALPRDSVVVSEDPEYAAWVKSNAHPIRSLGATDFSDLRFFAPLLANKRIVQLGESGHGVAEFSMSKVRLIKYLHERLGYDVIAFESSMYECERAQKDVAMYSAINLMRACIFSVWHSAETLPLFEYIKQTQSTSHPLILAGFDEQTSSSTVGARPGVYRSLVAPLDSSYAMRVYATDSTFLANRGATYASANQARLVAFYDSLANFLGTNRRAIEAAHRDDPNIAVIARQAAVSMTVYVRQLAAGQNAGGTEIRDLGMANNLDFLLNELYPGKKVIVWAHNFHIQHRETALSTAGIATGSPRTMGTWVAERHRRELYTIGLFMYRGSAAGNTRKPYPIAQSRSGSLESILHQAPWRYTFVDFSQVKRERGSEWVWKPITGLSWGTGPEQFVPRDEYDGVLFIDTVHVPSYR
jgi:erythromycin esterase